MKNKRNTLYLKFPNHPANIPVVRCAIKAFAEQANPTLETLNDILTALEEAVQNAITYAYIDPDVGQISVRAVLYDNNTLEITVSDQGVGISDIKKARSPLFTTRSKDHAGLGFTVMENFMDSVSVRSRPHCGRGTTVILKKTLEIRKV